MPLCEVLHQGRSQDRLQRALRAGRVSHAFVFTGPAGVGKEMLAVRFARLLICPSPREAQPDDQAAGRLTSWQDACGECVDCQLMTAGNHPDFHPIYRTLNKMHPMQKVRDRKATVLGIDVIRHFLIEKIGLRPSRGRAKVFLVTEAESLSEAAQNAMLKTLEEPPAASTLILLATSADVLLDTTQSRCQQIPFQNLPGSFVHQRLTERSNLSSDAAKFLTELSAGSVGNALRFVQYRLHEQVPQILKLLVGASADPLGCGKQLLTSAQALAEEIKTQTGNDEDDVNHAHRGQEMILAIVSTILRDVQRGVVGVRAEALPNAPQIAQLAQQTQTEPIREAIRAVATAEYQIGRHANSQLIFDSLGIALGRGLHAQGVSA